VNPATAFAQVLVDELVRCGLTDAVRAPGPRSAPLALAPAADDPVRLSVRIDERSAAFLALGLAKASGRPAALVCTSGTAAANFLPAVIEADQSRVPLLVLTADRPPELRGTGANQTIDQVGLYGGSVRWFCEVGVPEARAGSVTYWRSAASRAWAAATGAGGPPGPVHLNLALREPLIPQPGAPPFPEPLDGRPGGRPWTATRRPAAAPDPADVEEVAALVAGAERGLVVVGDRDGAQADGLLALADAAAWPVVSEPSGNARRGPRAVSTAALLLGDRGFAAAHRPDLVVVAGKVGLSRQVLGLLGSGVAQVRVDAHGGWLDPPRATDRLVVADPDRFAAEVAARVPARGATPWSSAWSAADAAVRDAVDGLLDFADELTEPRTARDLAAVLPDGSTLVAGSSMPIRDLDLTMHPRDGLRVVANRGASGIDGFTSTALGVALAADGPVAALCGDLTFLHDQNGLLVPPGSRRPDLVLVVIDNDGGGIFSLLPQAGVPSFEQVFGTPHGVDLVAVARAAGWPATRVTDAEDLPIVLTDALTTGGPSVLVVPSDRAANAALHTQLRQATTATLRSHR